MASYADWFVKELEGEMGKTRRMLAAVPDHDPEWRPDPKSMTVGRLAGHVAELPGWIVMTVTKDSFDLKSDYTPLKLEKGGRAELLAAFEKNAAAALAAMAGRTDEYLGQNWQLKFGEHTVVELPRTTVLADMCKNHMIHHRGQLSVYTRLLGAAVPGMYGPSADDKAKPPA